MHASLLHGNREISRPDRSPFTIGLVVKGLWPQTRMHALGKSDIGIVIGGADGQGCSIRRIRPIAGGIRGEMALILACFSSSDYAIFC